VTRFLLALYLTACGTQAEPAGAIRIRTDIASASLFVDGVDRGPLADGAELELPPGLHAIEARRADRVVARTQAAVRSSMLLELRLEEIPGAPIAPPIAPAIPPPIVPPETPPVGSGLDPTAVHAVVRRGQPGLRGCLESHLRTRPNDTSLRFDLDITVAPAGAVQEVHAQGGTDEHASLRACLETSVRTWSFPSATESSTLRVPVVFSSADQAPPQGALPETPSRTQIVEALQARAPSVRACGNGTTGVVLLRLTFGSSGAVDAVQATGSMPPPVLRCAEDAMREARVEPFSQASFSVNYPFRI
jgi:hypothetical protein